MEIISVRKGRTVKTVTLSNAPEVNDDLIYNAALQAAGETRSSIFGASFAYFDEDDLGLTAVVTLHTD